METDDPVCLREAHFQMKCQTAAIVQLAVAGKLRAALFSGPLLTADQQCPGITLRPVLRKDENPLQIAYGTAYGSLYIIMPQLALSKSSGAVFQHKQKNSALL